MEQNVGPGRPSKTTVTPLLRSPVAPLPREPAPGAGAGRDAALRAFTRPSAGPKATFPLALVAVTVAALSMWLDAVPRYSDDAFFAGVALTAVLAVLTGEMIGAIASAPYRLAASLLVPATFGGFVGMVVQALVLRDVGTWPSAAVRDLGGLVDTTGPLPWIASGVVLGGIPALLVSAFLVVAARSIRRLTGHDASEGFGVPFTGFAGVLAAFGLLLVDGVSAAPLFVVMLLAAITVLAALLVDGARLRFLRSVYAGLGAGFDVVPAERFASDPSLAPMVARGGAAAVLVRVPENVGSYRAAAAEPIALVAETEGETLRPLLRRRAVATAMLVAMAAFAGLAVLAHA
ncbi:MAG: hypothetical protein KF795_32010 [Labilithrix sp.]|nr:hypothetical protein [Labilithrix sp.]